MEVIVVDDGSTDDSREVIAGYGLRIIAVLKENGGQASAFNAGFAAARGDILIFLDSDDVLLSTAAEKAVERFHDGVAKVHWPLWMTNADLKSTGNLIPPDPLPAGDFRDRTFQDGPATSLSPPTSGNAWSRAFLERVMPIPESDHRIGADWYLYGLAPAFGLIERIDTPQGSYRIHIRNNYKHMPLDDRIVIGLRWVAHQWRLLSAHARQVGKDVDPATWERGSHFYQLRQALAEIETVIPRGETLVLLDESQWAAGDSVRGRSVLPFPERDGQYAGKPTDDSEAIVELERLRSVHDAGYLVVAWPGFWWLEYYAEFARHLHSNYPCVLASERVVVFRLEGR